MTLLDHALAYAARGWPVFPCSPETKQPLVAKESQPGAKDGGLYLATTDQTQIRRWWQRHPQAMIGVPTGAKTGLVIDLDPKIHGADDMLVALAEWLAQDLTVVPMVRTQSGGLHLWFAMPEGARLGNRAGLFRKIDDAPEAIREHVDVRGEGGYVIVPPSVMASGTFYEWVVPIDGALPPPPAKLADAIAKKLDSRGGATAPAAPAARPMAAGDDPVAKARHRYAMAALDREIGELSRTGEGSRGFELNKVAYSLGGLAGADLLSRDLVRRELWMACERNGLAAKDGAEKTWANIDRCLAQGMARPIDVSQIGARAGKGRSSSGARATGTSQGTRTGGADRAAPLDSSDAEQSPAPPGDSEEGPASHPGESPGKGSAGGAGDDVELRCAGLPLTDLGNAQRFLARFGADFLYVEQWGWLAWDGTRWNTHEAEAMVQRAVHDTIKAIAEEAHQIRLWQLWFDHMVADIEKTEKDFAVPWPDIDYTVDLKKDKVVRFADKLSGWCLASQSNAHLSCVAKLVQHYLTAAPERFDADAMAFNVANGTLRFARVAEGDYVTFHPHRRGDLITKIAPVAYDPAATAPLYDKYLERVQPEVAMRRHLHAWGGLSLTALQVAKLSFWYGTGRNGKSVLADTWAFLLGDYVQTIPIESFLDQGRARRGGEASPDIASLPGVRMLRTSEPEKRSKLAESMIKLVTGGEALRARHLNRDFFEFKPSFKLVMQGNYKPSIEGTDEGIWARMMLVPWMVMIPEAERDAGLTVKLQGEASGILNRLLDGLRDYLDHGLSPPAAVIDATAEYREDSDPIGRFLRDCTEPAPKERAPGGGLYMLFAAWAKANGEHKWSAKAFKRGLADHGIRHMKSSTMFYLDIRATKTVADFQGDSFGDDDDGGGH